MSSLRTSAMKQQRALVIKTAAGAKECNLEEGTETPDKNKPERLGETGQHGKGRRNASIRA